MAEQFTLFEVVARTGAKRRAVQLWADGGVLKSVPGTDRAGTGVHRAFYGWEVRIAALLVPLAKWGVPIGHLKSFAAALRPMAINAKAPQPDFRGANDAARKITKVLGRAIDGTGENYLLFTWGDDYQWISVRTDDDTGAACICPSRDFHVALKTHKDATAFVVIDLTARLHALLD